MAMISLTELFYGEREAVQILKDEHREILEIIHRYNYFYTEPPPPSDADASDDSEDEDVESNWQELEESFPKSESPRQSTSVRDEDESYESAKLRTSSASKPADTESLQLSEAAAVQVTSLKVPMCCQECEETVTIALKNVAGVADVVTLLLKELVIVTGTASPGDLLLACRDFKLFRKTRLWRDDSD